MKRRHFLKSSTLAGVGMATTLNTSHSSSMTMTESTPFRMNYAPHFGQFKALAGEGLAGQLHFMADQGFRALEDNGMMKRSVEDQRLIAREMEQLGMTMGVFVASASFKEMTFVHRESREMLVQRMREAVEVGKRVNARWATVVPDAYDPGLEWDYQTANVIDNLKACAEICEPAGLIMVLEPLNPWANHPGLFLSRIPQAYQICKAVGSPSCKILDDLYHQQITEGNLIPNLETAWDEIAYLQVGDNPGRNEPGTGEINYRNIFKYLHDKEYKGLIGMEHGTQAVKQLNNRKKAGETIAKAEEEAAERTLITAYRTVDDFETTPMNRD